MVTVRESPRAQLSPSKSHAQWPPKSPFQALLSSPSGRRKWQDHATRGAERSVSPSPVKGSNARRDMLEEEDEEEDEEDEETVQLRLQAIEAKIKLKKLRQKAKKAAGVDHSSEVRSSSASPRKTASAPPRPRPRGTDVEVPLSPTKESRQAQQPPSPARARLGLAPTLRAEGVSLKRARDGTQLKRTDSRLTTRRDEDVFGVTKKTPTSFSERLAKTKVELQDKQAKLERIERARSKGFGGALQGERRQRDVNAPEERLARPSSAHATAKHDREAGIARNDSTRTVRERERKSHTKGLFTAQAPHSRPSARADDDESSSVDISTSPPRPSTSEEATPAEGYDPISTTHLSKRHIPHPDIARALQDKQIYTLPRLLKEVVAPVYEPPDCEEDYVLFAVLASKSSPFDQKAAHHTSDEHKAQEDAEKPRNKFMVLHLTDLKWELDCFLFGTAFDRFWKLTPGTLLAILNPGIMPPKGNQHTGRFSLKLGSSEDSVMEIGVARDLGYCSSVKSDGKVCGQWIDKRKTEICEFHLNLMIDRERKGRMEVNGMWRGTTKGSGGEGGRESHHRGGKNKKKGEGNGGPTYHREYGNLYTVPGTGVTSAANLLDAEDKVGALSEEASRKRIAAVQRERDLARKLGALGDSVGSEYFRSKEQGTGRGTVMRSGDLSAQQAKDLFEKPSASELGLLGKKASEQRLSPAKDRKRHFGMGAVGTSGMEGMGWGGARKAGLLERPKEKEKEKATSPERRPGIVRGRSALSEEGSLSPKKRARFALAEKGIREPGRESLGGPEKVKFDLEDDELDIV